MSHPCVRLFCGGLSEQGRQCCLFLGRLSPFSPFLCCGEDAANTRGGRKINFSRAELFVKGRGSVLGGRQGRSGWVFLEMPKLIQRRESRLMKQVVISSLA